MSHGPQENDLLKPSPGKRTKPAPPPPEGDEATPAYWAQKSGQRHWRGAIRRAGIAPAARLTETDFQHAVERYNQVVMH